jgi:hypothetical protein
MAIPSHHSFIHGSNNNIKSSHKPTNNHYPFTFFRINTFLSLHAIWNHRQHHHFRHHILYPGDWIDWINNNQNWTIRFIRGTRDGGWTCSCSIRACCHPIPSFVQTKPFVVSTLCRTMLIELTATTRVLLLMLIIVRTPLDMYVVLMCCCNAPNHRTDCTVSHAANNRPVLCLRS